MSGRVTVALESVAQGRAIIHIAKCLKPYSESASLARYLSSTRLAGRAGLLVSSIKSSTSFDPRLPVSAVEAFCHEVSIDSITYYNYVTPWMADNAFCYIERDENDKEFLVPTVTSYEAILKGVAALYSRLERSEAPVARAVHHLVVATSNTPLLQSEVMPVLVDAYGLEGTVQALELSRAYKLLSFSQTGGAQDALIYSSRVWKDIDAKLPAAMSSLSLPDRAFLKEIIGMVKDYQGMPESLLRTFLAKEGGGRLLDMAIGLKLITKTAITARGGQVSYTFLTTPHFYADVADEFGDDICDRVKIFLDSIRQGQHFSESSRGRIRDPQVLLGALINKGQIGPATAIGEDYLLAERAGIIRVERSSSNFGYMMELRQADVVKKTLQVLERKSMEPGAPSLAPQGFAKVNSGNFVSEQENNIRMGDLPGEMREIEREFVNSLRE